MRFVRICARLQAAFVLSMAMCAVAQTDTSSSVKARSVVSLTLPKALELATSHNRRLQLARLQVADAQEKKKIQEANYFPHIKNESTALHVTEIEGVVIPAGAFSSTTTAGLIPSSTIRIGQGANDAFTSGTGLTQPLTQLLRVHDAVRAAASDVEAAKDDASSAEDSIALLVSKLYYEILIRQTELRAAEESVKASAVAEQESTRAIEEGKSLEIAGLEARAFALQQQQASLASEIAVNDLMMQFDDVLGLPLGTRLQLDPKALGEYPVLPSEEAAVAIFVARNPKLLTAREAVEKAKAAVAAAKEAYIPDVTAVARYSYQSGIPFLVHNFGTFGGLVSYDLFDGGAREAKVSQARVQLHMAEIQVAQTQADLSVEVSAAYDKIRRLEQLVNVASEALDVRREQVRLVQTRFDADAALPSDVSRSQAGEAAAEASVLEARLDLLLLQKQVLTLLGQRPN